MIKEKNEKIVDNTKINSLSPSNMKHFPRKSPKSRSRRSRSLDRSKKKLTYREQNARVQARFEKDLKKAEEAGRQKQKEIESGKKAPVSKKIIAEKDKDAVRKRFEKDMAKYETKGA